MMSKLFLAIFLSGALMASSFAKEVVKIGVVFPLTGASAAIGEANLEAVKMALSEIPKDSKFEYQLFFEDNQGEPRLSSMAAQKLININKVDVLISIFAGPGNVISPIAEKAKVLHFAITADPVIAKGEYNFIYYYLGEDWGRKWAEGFSQHGYKRISILTLNQQGCLVITKAFEKIAPQYNLEIVDHQIVSPGEKDFRSFIGKAQSKKPDAYLIFSIAPEMDILWNQFRKMGIKEFYTGYLDAAQDTKPMENIWFVNMHTPKGDFQKRFEGNTNHKMMLGVPAAYDDISILVRAYESFSEPGKPSTKWTAHQINQTAESFSGISSDFKYDKDNGIFRLEPGINVIKNGLVENYETKK
jgi:ABC-type branched-subunit amino acid transport system substrate-binding protein